MLNYLDPLDVEHDVQPLRDLARAVGINSFYRWSVLPLIIAGLACAELAHRFLSYSILTLPRPHRDDEDLNVANTAGTASLTAMAVTARSKKGSEFDNALAAMQHIAAEFADIVQPFSPKVIGDATESVMGDADGAFDYFGDKCYYANDVEQVVAFCHRIGHAKGIQTVIGKISQSFERFDETKKEENLESYLAPLLHHWILQWRIVQTVGTRTLPFKESYFTTLVKQVGQMLLTRGLPQSSDIHQFVALVTCGGLLEELKTL